jgi:hypothetical protein
MARPMASLWVLAIILIDAPRVRTVRFFRGRQLGGLFMPLNLGMPAAGREPRGIVCPGLAQRHLFGLLALFAFIDSHQFMWLGLAIL